MTLPHKAVQLCGQLNVRFWCFVFVLRCLIYKVHAAFVRRTSDILSYVSEFVKPFFQVFSKLFFAVLFSDLPLATAWLYYHLFPEKSTPNFQIFRNFSTFFVLAWILFPKNPCVSRVFHSFDAFSNPLRFPHCGLSPNHI